MRLGAPSVLDLSATFALLKNHPLGFAGMFVLSHLEDWHTRSRQLWAENGLSEG